MLQAGFYLSLTFSSGRVTPFVIQWVAELKPWVGYGDKCPAKINKTASVSELYLTIKNSAGVGAVARLVECFTRMHQVLGSRPRAT